MTRSSGTLTEWTPAPSSEDGALESARLALEALIVCSARPPVATAPAAAADAAAFAEADAAAFAGTDVAAAREPAALAAPLPTLDRAEDEGGGRFGSGALVASTLYAAALGALVCLDISRPETGAEAARFNVFSPAGASAAFHAENLHGPAPAPAQPLAARPQRPDAPAPAPASPPAPASAAPTLALASFAEEPTGEAAGLADDFALESLAEGAAWTIAFAPDLDPVLPRALAETRARRKLAPSSVPPPAAREAAPEILVRHAGGAREAEAARRSLEDAGVAVAALLGAGGPIQRTRVRYYDSAQSLPATRLAALLGAGAPVLAEDAARPNRIEVEIESGRSD